ncbi:DoxX family protein [Micromonospora sp. STR1s_5]|nr:DoxX family protein [Micromonospora sp. STR1s_5]
MLIAALLLPSGVQKLFSFWKFAGSLAAKGVPLSKAVAAVDVAIEVIGPLALVVGLWPQAIALVLLGFTLVTTWTTYRYGLLGPAFRNPQLQPHLFKNLAVIAGLAFYYASGAGAWSRSTLRG